MTVTALLISAIAANSATTRSTILSSRARASGRQIMGIRISGEAHRITLKGNTLEGCRTLIEDLRSNSVMP